MDNLREMLLSIVNNMAKETYRSIVLDILNNPTLTFTSTKPLIQLGESPAAPRKHHFFSGGLLLHTLSVALIARSIAKIFENLYGVDVDEDLVVSAAILHDIFKYYQYAVDDASGGYKPRDDWYLSHDYAIVAELSRRNAPDALIRVVSEAHGIAPFSTIEGLIVHLADSIDARFGEYLQNILLSKLKEIEKEGCNIYKILNELIKRYGLRNVVQEAQKSGLTQKAIAICKEGADK